jgi:hypothetical protein
MDKSTHLIPQLGVEFFKRSKLKSRHLLDMSHLQSSTVARQPVPSAPGPQGPRGTRGTRKLHGHRTKSVAYVADGRGVKSNARRRRCMWYLVADEPVRMACRLRKTSLAPRHGCPRAWVSLARCSAHCILISDLDLGFAWGLGVVCLRNEECSDSCIHYAGQEHNM